MRGTIAKRLRKMVGHHPSNPVTYRRVQMSYIKGKGWTVWLDPSCSKARYRDLKRGGNIA